MLGLFRRQVARAQEDHIPDELIANIPLVAKDAPPAEDTLFVIESEEIIVVSPPEPQASDRSEPSNAGVPPEPVPSGLAAQLRYEMGEAFARELDRAEAAMNAALGELETRLAAAEADLASAREEVERERQARINMERRLAAFKELALK